LLARLSTPTSQNEEGLIQFSPYHRPRRADFGAR
jgi:hypothetical protein